MTTEEERKEQDRIRAPGFLRIGGMYQLTSSGDRSKMGPSGCGTFIYRQDNQFFRSWVEYYKRENNKNMVQWVENYVTAASHLPPDSLAPVRYWSYLFNKSTFMLLGYGITDDWTHIRLLTADGKDCFVSVEHLYSYFYSLNKLV